MKNQSEEQVKKFQDRGNYALESFNCFVEIKRGRGVGVEEYSTGCRREGVGRKLIYREN